MLQLAVLTWYFSIYTWRTAWFIDQKTWSWQQGGGPSLVSQENLGFDVQRQRNAKTICDRFTEAHCVQKLFRLAIWYLESMLVILQNECFFRDYNIIRRRFKKNSQSKSFMKSSCTTPIQSARPWPVTLKHEFESPYPRSTKWWYGWYSFGSPDFHIPACSLKDGINTQCQISNNLTKLFSSQAVSPDLQESSDEWAFSLETLPPLLTFL
jgi:hypothetical protein